MYFIQALHNCIICGEIVRSPDNNEVHYVQLKWILTLSIWSQNLIPQNKRFSVTTLPPAPFQMPFTSPGPAVSLTDRLYTRGSHHPILRFDNLLTWHPELRKTLYWYVMLRYRGFLRDSHIEEIHKARYGAGSFHVLSSRAPSRHHHGFANPKALCISCFRSFLWFSLQPLPLPQRSVGGAEMSNPLIIFFFWFPVSSWGYLRASTLSYSIRISSRVIQKGLFMNNKTLKRRWGNSEGFRNSVLEMGNKEHIFAIPHLLSYFQKTF